MIQKAITGAGNIDNNNVLIFADMLLTNNEGISYYDKDYFNYISGAFRANYIQTTEISLSFKKKSKIAIYYTQHSGYDTVQVEINNVSIRPTRSYTKTNITVNPGDVLYFKTTQYYGGIMILDNPDLTKYQGYIYTET